MTKEDFVKEFKEKLKLSEKSWDFIKKGNRKDGYIAVSAYKEIDKDFLYYNYVGVIWELDLNKLVLGKTVREHLKDCLALKGDSDAFRLQIIPGGKNNMVEVNLSMIGTIIKPYESKILEKEEKLSVDIAKEVSLEITSKESAIKEEILDNSTIISNFLDIDRNLFNKALVLNEILDLMSTATYSEKLSVTSKLKQIIK